MKAVLMNINGHDYLIRFEYIAETWGEPARIDIDEGDGRWLEPPNVYQVHRAGRAEILAMYGKQLQEQASEEYAMRRDERPCHD